MEKLLDSVTLGTIFRHFVSGAIFTVSFLYARHGITRTLISRIEQHPWTLGIVSLLVGAIIYALHRGLTNPLFEVLRHYWIPADRVKWLIPGQVKEMLLDRWDYTDGIKKSGRHIYEWGDYVHFLYTSAFAVWAGSLASCWTSSRPQDFSWSYIVFWTGLVLMVAGLVTDYRKQVIEAELYCRAKKAASDSNKSHTETRNSSRSQDDPSKVLVNGQ